MALNTSLFSYGHRNRCFEVSLSLSLSLSVEWPVKNGQKSGYGAAAAKSLQSCLTLCDPTDGSPPGSPGPLGSPGKNTGVGCHFLLQCMKGKSESEVAQSCPTPSDPMDCSLPGSSIHGIFQARELEWVAIAFSQDHSLDIGKLPFQKPEQGKAWSKHNLPCS